MHCCQMRNLRLHGSTQNLSTTEAIRVPVSLPLKIVARYLLRLHYRPRQQPIGPGNSVNVTCAKAITRPADAVIAQTKTLRTAPSLLLDKFPHYCTTIVQKKRA